MSPASCRAPQREQGQTWRVSFLRSSDAAGGCIGCQMRQLREEAETAVAVARDRGIALAFPEMDQDRGGLPTAPLGTHCVSAARSHANFELGPVLGHHEVAADAPRGDAEEVSCSLSVVVSRTWPSRRTRRCVQRRRGRGGFSAARREFARAVGSGVRSAARERRGSKDPKPLPPSLPFSNSLSPQVQASSGSSGAWLREPCFGERRSLHPRPMLDMAWASVGEGTEYRREREAATCKSGVGSQLCTSKGFQTIASA